MPDYYDFEVSLCDAPSHTWRRFLLAKRGATFADLHQAIQDACGWQDCHLYLFKTDSRGEILAEAPFEASGPVSSEVRLSEYFSSRGARECLYEYDFGDSWQHRVVLHRMVRRQETLSRRLQGGQRAFPPEDCGGIPGYLRFSTLVTVGEDPWDEGDVAELKMWIGKWHPEAFSLEEAKARFDR